MNVRTSFALRTLLGPWLAPLALVIEVANLVQRSSPWRGETMWTLEWVAITLFVLGPLAAGVTAVDAARIAHPDAVYLAIPTRRPLTTFVRAAAWCAVPLLVIHTSVYLGAVVAGGSPLSTAARTDMALQLIVQLTAIVWFVAIGSIVGRFSPPLLAGVLGAIAGLFLFYGLSGSSLGTRSFSLLDLGGATVTQLGWRYDPGYLGVQFAALAASSALLFLVPLAQRSSRAMPDRRGVAILAVTLIAVAGVQSAGPALRKELTAPEAPDLCVEGAPTICLYSYYHRDHEEILAAVRHLVDAASDNGYRSLVPARVEQESYNYAPTDPSVRSFFLDPSDMHDGWESEILIQGMVAPRCAEMSSEVGPPETFWVEMGQVISTWSVIAGLPDPWGTMAPGDELTPDEVTAILERWSTCDLDGSSR